MGADSHWGNTEIYDPGDFFVRFKSADLLLQGKNIVKFAQLRKAQRSLNLNIYV
jgi:hypothetical protein